MQHGILGDGSMKYGFGIPGLDPSIKGLGDVVAAVAEVTGVAAVARTVMCAPGIDCPRCRCVLSPKPPDRTGAGPARA